MRFPRMWLLKRPGHLIPVFFLSSAVVTGQIPLRTASSVSAGGCYVLRNGYSAAALNQAGLGTIQNHSVSLQQSVPFLIGDLAKSSLSAYYSTGMGALGTNLTTFGITGMRHSSLWISCGLMLSRDITAGMGLHFWSISSPERIFHHPGISCALGMQIRISENLMIGGHVMHPVAWSAAPTFSRNRQMKIAMGMSYSYFSSYKYFGELHLTPEGRLQMSHGIEAVINEAFHLSAGFHNCPVSFAGGMEWSFSGWTIQIAFEYLLDRGSTPYTTLAYEW